MATDVTALLTQFTLRYRTALLTRVLVLGGLGLVLAGLIAWRLSPLPLASMWRFGVPAVLAAGGIGALAVWASRRWPSQRASAAHLDRVLGLKQRLVTAEEFSRVPNPPALYPLLMEDVIRRTMSPRAAYPRPMDRAAFMLALLALLLLLWPFGGRSPLTQLAHLTQPTPRPDPSTPPPSQQPPPPPQQQQQGASQQSSSSAQSSSGGHNQPPSSERDSASAGGGSSSSQGGQQGSSSGGQRGTGQDAGSTGQAAGAQRGQQESGGAQQQAAQPAGQQGNEKGGQAGADGGAGTSRGQPSDAKAQQQAGAGNGPMSSQAQQALQEDIQKLLKDVSGELKDLQKRLESQDQPPPTPGATTDPELYGASDAAGAPTGEASVPIQLKTDAAGTGSSRKSSGSGRPSGETSAASPTAKAEPAQLADEPLEEPAGSRETVPPEYQDVFKQLNRSREHQSTAR